ncbi:MAG: DNA helicase UvrD [Candidatus Omnitrophica bacterium]|nr:DNA helicase UvrD [Candidatus Omnitrophota bacterium]
MKVVADFHLHSRYSRATSSQMDLDLLAQWARYKGIHLLGTGDCTHPLWMQELKQKLRPGDGGLYEYKGVKFLLTAEVNNLFTVGGKSHRIHNLLFLPTIEAAEALNKRLGRCGDLSSDGRPMLRLSARDLVRMALDTCAEALVIPAHAWTPWFSIFGASSGFDTVEECFQDQAKEIFALETGLSSDPAMNWRLSRLDRYTLISNSDSHSASRIGREANVFDCEPSYREIAAILKTKDTKRFLYTIEFFPEEGKYHLDGHRLCKTRLTPEETAAQGGRCPACGRKVTVGVLHRVGDLADRAPGYRPADGVPFRNLVPLDQIIADSRGVGVATKQVEQEYLDLVQRVGTELEILTELPEEVLRKSISPRLAEGILRVRAAQVKILPGYDGEYGQVRIYEDAAGPAAEKQMTLF